MVLLKNYKDGYTTYNNHQNKKEWHIKTALCQQWVGLMRLSLDNKLSKISNTLIALELQFLHSLIGILRKWKEEYPLSLIYINLGQFIATLINMDV